MNRTILPASLMLAAASAMSISVPAHAAEVQIQSSGPVVELTVMEQVEADPDLVTIGAGVSTEAATAVEAMRLNSAQMRKVIDRIKSLGVPERDIQTTGINLNAQYNYRNNLPPVFRAYQASNNVSVKLRNIDKTGEVLDALVAAGANNLNGPNFSIENDEAAKAEARKSAMTRARGQAMEYARLAGYSKLRLLEVSETITGSRPMPVMRDAIIVTASKNESAPVQPGRVSTGVSVTVKYEMQ